MKICYAITIFYVNNTQTKDRSETYFSLNIHLRGKKWLDANAIEQLNGSLGSIKRICCIASPAQRRHEKRKSWRVGVARRTWLTALGAIPLSSSFRHIIQYSLVDLYIFGVLTLSIAFTSCYSHDRKSCTWCISH